MPMLSHLHQLFNADQCQAYIHTLRWKDRPLQCPRCQSEVVTRGVSTGRGNLTLDSLYLSDGRLCNPSENRVNNINMLEVYHKIRGNVAISP
jgi:hypothetical protein